MLTETGVIDHPASVKRIAEVSLAYAKAGKEDILFCILFEFILFYTSNLLTLNLGASLGMF